MTTPDGVLPWPRARLVRISWSRARHRVFVAFVGREKAGVKINRKA